MSSHPTHPPAATAGPAFLRADPVQQSHGGPAPSEPRPPRGVKKLVTGYPVAALIALSLVVGTSGCGDVQSASPATVPPATVTQGAATPPAPPTVTQTVRETVTATTSEPAAAKTPPPRRTASKITVPNGVGMNYQKAQDAWRESGLHVSPAKDASGANRLPFLDSNWIVLSQDLEPGTTVEVDSFITAIIKKKTDN